MKSIRITYRIVALAILSLTGVVLMLFTQNDKNGSTTKKQKNIRQWWLKKVIKIVGLQLDVMGDKPKDSDSALWVANHVSWLDIPVIGSEGVTFLSKAEVRKWPVIGWLGKKGGTVYIQRGGQGASGRASEKIAKTIHSGDSILVFPEATISDGKDVKRFHARIFAPALDHALKVQPIAIRYLDKEGQYHPDIPWGDESFFTNLFTVLGESALHVELNFLPAIDAEDFSERKHLANEAYNQIRSIVKMDINGTSLNKTSCD